MNVLMIGSGHAGNGRNGLATPQPSQRSAKLPFKRMAGIPLAQCCSREFTHSSHSKTPDCPIPLGDESPMSVPEKVESPEWVDSDIERPVLATSRYGRSAVQSLDVKDAPPLYRRASSEARRTWCEGRRAT